MPHENETMKCFVENDKYTGEEKSTAAHRKTPKKIQLKIIVIRLRFVLVFSTFGRIQILSIKRLNYRRAMVVEIGACVPYD